MRFAGIMILLLMFGCQPKGGTAETYERNIEIEGDINKISGIINDAVDVISGQLRESVSQEPYKDAPPANCISQDSPEERQRITLPLHTAGKANHPRSAASPLSVKIMERRTKVTQPSGAITPAIIETGDTKASTGAVSKVDQAIAAMSGLQPWGLIISLVGVGALIARRWVPVIPVVAGLAAIAFGVGIMFLPVIADRYLGWILTAVVAAAILYVVIVGSKLNWFKRKTGPDEQIRLLAKGDAETAAALKFLETRSKAEARDIKQGSR